VTGGNVTADGQINITGSSTSVGTNVTIRLQPTMTAAGQITWVCQVAQTTLYRYVPSECRNPQS
jgi:hypothetical protein